MELSKNIPDYITENMRAWLSQFKQDQLNPIKKIGLFHWEFRTNRRNPEKPRRIPRIDEYVNLEDRNFRHEIYFHPFDEETLHVYESSGISLGGLNISHEYFLKDEKFLQTKILMKMIR